jgi:hypothetical protein
MGTTRMGSGKMSEKGKKIARTLSLSIGGLAVITIVVLGILAGAGVLSIGTNTPAVVVPDEYEIVLHDALDSTNDDEIDDAATITWYRAKVSTFEDDEDWEDLAYSDFSADGTGDDKNPDDDYTYIASITGTDLVAQWVCTDSRVFEGYLPMISLGSNDVYVYNETEDLALSAYSPVGGTTFNQTDYRDWTVVVNCLDASESASAEVTSLEGYGYYYDPSAGTWMTPVIAVTFNTTATNAFGEIQDTLTVSEAAAASVLYFEIQSNISGSTEFDLRLGSALGTTFEVTQIAVGWGYSGSFSSKDTQN